MSLLSFIFPISQSISKYFRVFFRRSLPRYARCRQPPLTHDTNNSISTTHYTSPKYSVSRSASRCRTTSSTNPSLQLTSGNICCCCDICSVKKFAEKQAWRVPKTHCGEFLSLYLRSTNSIVIMFTRYAQHVCNIYCLTSPCYSDPFRPFLKL